MSSTQLNSARFSPAPVLWSVGRYRRRKARGTMPRLIYQGHPERPHVTNSRDNAENSVARGGVGIRRTVVAMVQRGAGSVSSFWEKLADGELQRGQRGTEYEGRCNHWRSGGQVRRDRWGRQRGGEGIPGTVQSNYMVTLRDSTQQTWPTALESDRYCNTCATGGAGWISQSVTIITSRYRDESE